MRLLFPLVLLLGWLAGCAPERESSQSTLPPLDFETRRFDRQGGACPDDGSDCIRISLRYPEATGGPAAFREPFNAFVHQYLVSVLDENPQGDSQALLDTLAGRLLADYARYSAESDISTAWSLEVKGEIIYRSPERVSVQLNSYSYMGGAHPNAFTTLATFDLATGAELSLSDMIRDTLAFRPLAEAAFRAVHKIAPDQDLGEAGFYFPEDRFLLPANYALHPDGILLHYNAYEVGPYVLGATRLVVSREQLGDLLR